LVAPRSLAKDSTTDGILNARSKPLEWNHEQWTLEWAESVFAMKVG
jgi:hypothetical protein